MALELPLYMQNVAYPARTDRLMVDAMRSPGLAGSASDLAVTQRAAGTNMSVDVANGSCVIAGTDTAGQGSYLCKSTAVENVVLDAAPGVGNSRIDRIVARVYDGQVIGSGPSEWTIEAVTGTASPSPSLPSLPNSCLELARVTVASGTAAITNAMISDQRVPGTPRILAGTIATDRLQDAAVTPAKLAGNVGVLRVASINTIATTGSADLAHSQVFNLTTGGFTSDPYVVPVIFSLGTGYRNMYIPSISALSPTSVTVRILKADGGAQTATVDTVVHMLAFKPPT
jgi:hypothetical protein